MRRGSTLLFHSGRPVSRPKRRALPRPLPDAPSRLRPEGRLQPAAAPLCPLSGGTLPVHCGFISIILPARPTCVKAGAVFFTARGSSPRAARLSKKADAFSAKEISLRSAPRSSAHGRRFDARSAQSVFPTYTPPEKRFYFLSPPSGGETLRGFFDTLKRPLHGAARSITAGLPLPQLPPHPPRTPGCPPAGSGGPCRWRSKC